jgi:hypothetical protein
MLFAFLLVPFGMLMGAAGPVPRGVKIKVFPATPRKTSAGPMALRVQKTGEPEIRSAR